MRNRRSDISGLVAGRVTNDYLGDGVYKGMETTGSGNFYKVKNGIKRCRMRIMVKAMEKKDGPVEMERFHLALFVLAFGSRFFGK